MQKLFESISQLKPAAQVLAVGGLLALLFLVAFQPLAAATIISFLTALVSLFGGSSNNNNQHSNPAVSPKGENSTAKE